MLDIARPWMCLACGACYATTHPQTPECNVATRRAPVSLILAPTASSKTKQYPICATWLGASTSLKQHQKGKKCQAKAEQAQAQAAVSEVKMKKNNQNQLQTDANNQATNDSECEDLSKLAAEMALERVGAPFSLNGYRYVISNVTDTLIELRTTSASSSSSSSDELSALTLDEFCEKFCLGAIVFDGDVQTRVADDAESDDDSEDTDDDENDEEDGEDEDEEEETVAEVSGCDVRMEELLRASRAQ
jgi:hypothetical protein